MVDNIGWAGPPEAAESDLNDAVFVAQQIMAHARQATIVKVLAVHPGTWSTQNNGTPTTIDVQPMIDQVNSEGTRQAHGTIYGIICSRHHSGGNAIRNDPVVGDVGFMTVSDRDHSQLYQNNGAQSAPGSNRRFSLSDGIYWGGIFTPQPTNLIDISGGNVAVTSPGNISHTTTGNNTSISSIASGTGDSITHTAAKGSIVDSAPQGSITHTAAVALALNAPVVNIS